MAADPTNMRFGRGPYTDPNGNDLVSWWLRFFKQRIPMVLPLIRFAPFAPNRRTSITSMPEGVGHVPAHRVADIDPWELRLIQDTVFFRTET